MAVLNTTSPTASPVAPKERPRNTFPSASASSASPSLPAPASIPLTRARPSAPALAFVVHDAALDDGEHRSAAHRPALERGVLALGPELLAAHGPLEIGIDHRDVGGTADLERSGPKPEDASGLASNLRDRARQVEQALAHEPKRQRQQRLEADDAVRRGLELAILLVAVVRRVVGRDRVDGAVGEP